MSDHTTQYQLRARKYGVTKVCTGFWNDYHGAVLSWQDQNNVLAAIKPCLFRTEKQAWYMWYQWKKLHPDLCLDWTPEVVSYEP